MKNLDDIKLQRFDLHWLVEAIPEGFWSLYPMPDGTWLGAFVEKYFQGVLIFTSVLFVLYREALVVERLRRLPRTQEVVGSNPTEGKICFVFTVYSIL